MDRYLDTELFAAVLTFDIDPRFRLAGGYQGQHRAERFGRHHHPARTGEAEARIPDGGRIQRTEDAKNVIDAIGTAIFGGAGDAARDRRKEERSVRRNVIETVMGAVVLLVAIAFIVFAFRTSGLTADDGYQS